jgi:hypothetical protein
MSLCHVIDEMPHIIIGAIPEGNGHTGCLPKLAEIHAKQLLWRKGKKASSESLL